MDVSRRRIIVWGLGALAFGRAAGLPALAQQMCRPQRSMRSCQAHVDCRSLDACYDEQRSSEWCWAACISMVFAHHGHKVAQERIVKEVYGRPVNKPAIAGEMVTAMLSRKWLDDKGNPFVSRISSLYDIEISAAVLPDKVIVEDLSNNRPLIVGTNAHMMIVTAAEYVETRHGPSVARIGVYDPYPGIGPRQLDSYEMTPSEKGGGLTYLASVDVR